MGKQRSLHLVILSCFMIRQHFGYFYFALRNYDWLSLQDEPSRRPASLHSGFWGLSYANWGLHIEKAALSLLFNSASRFWHSLVGPACSRDTKGHKEDAGLAPGKATSSQHHHTTDYSTVFNQLSVIRKPHRERGLVNVCFIYEIH